jgi:hypothetical protein
VHHFPPGTVVSGNVTELSAPRAVEECSTPRATRGEHVRAGTITREVPAPGWTLAGPV